MEKHGIQLQIICQWKRKETDQKTLEEDHVKGKTPRNQNFTLRPEKQHAPPAPCDLSSAGVSTGATKLERQTGPINITLGSWENHTPQQHPITWEVVPVVPLSWGWGRHLFKFLKHDLVLVGDPM